MLQEQQEASMGVEEEAPETAEDSFLHYQELGGKSIKVKEYNSIFEKSKHPAIPVKPRCYR